MLSELMRREYYDEELKALILNFIMRKGRWGEHYFPIDTMANWLGQIVKNNGKNVKKKVKDLAKEGFLILHKMNTTASLNPRMKGEIIEYIEKNLRESNQLDDS
jgi:hypothetical protein